MLSLALSSHSMCLGLLLEMNLQVFFLFMVDFHCRGHLVPFSALSASLRSEISLFSYSFYRFLGARKRVYNSLHPSVVCSDGWSVRPHITLSAFFSAVCRWIDLKFGRDLHVDLLFQFLFFFLNSSSNSSSSSEIELYIFSKPILKLDAFCLLNRDILWLNLKAE
jgi:hypothetical protein